MQDVLSRSKTASCLITSPEYICTVNFHLFSDSTAYSVEWLSKIFISAKH